MMNTHIFREEDETVFVPIVVILAQEFFIVDHLSWTTTQLPHMPEQEASTVYTS